MSSRSVLMVGVALFLLSFLLLLCGAETTTIPQIDSVGDHGDDHNAPRFYAPFAPSLYASFTEAPHLHFVVMSIPLWGHWKPLAAVAEELMLRGHKITYLVEEGEWCRRLLPPHRQAAAEKTGSTCVNVVSQEAVQQYGTPPKVFTPSFFQKLVERRYFRFLRSFSDLFDAMLQHHRVMLPYYWRAAVGKHTTITTFLCDVSTFVCPSVAAAVGGGLPVVHVYPLSTQLAIGLHPELPTLGTGYPRRMHVGQRLWNTVLKLTARLTVGPTLLRRLNHDRGVSHIPPLESVYEAAGFYDTMITPTLWGLDIPQPLCPNIHPVGLLTPTGEQTSLWLDQDKHYGLRRHNHPYYPGSEKRGNSTHADRLTIHDSELLSFLEECKGGVIYVSFSTLVPLSESFLRVLAASFLRTPSMCFVWRLEQQHIDHVVLPLIQSVAETNENPARMLLRPWFDSPAAILHHRSTFAFFSHCGDTSVQEAIEHAVPVIGIPLFADQADVCQRVVEARIGVRVPLHSRSVASLTALDEVAIQDAIHHVLKDGDTVFRPRLKRLKDTGVHLGGVAAAADIIEDRQYNLLLRRGDSLERCEGVTGDPVMGWVKRWGPYLVLYLLLTFLWYRLLDYLFLKTSKGERRPKTREGGETVCTARIVPRPVYPREPTVVRRPVTMGI